MPTNKSLGQHWLTDRSVLTKVASEASITAQDTVLEIGPGLGTLTSILLGQANKVVAVEYDDELARKLPGQFPGKNLEVVSGNILEFDLSKMPAGYKVVANIPYYITSKIVQLLVTSRNKPSVAVLLTQKEVAERMAARPGEMSVLGVSTQVFAEVSLGPIVEAELFTPAPLVDSRVVVMRMRPVPLVGEPDQKRFFKLVKAGFSSRRKKLRSSLAGALNESKPEIERILGEAAIDPNLRAEDLSINDWLKIMEVIND